MTEINYLGIAILGVAILLSFVAFMEYARKKMTDGCLLLWMLISIGLVVMGIILIVGGHLSRVALGVLLTTGILLFLLIFVTTRMVSELTMKTRELAMQVALLNQENETMLQELNQLKEMKDANQEESK